MTSPGDVRRVEIKTLSAKVEFAHVFRLSMAIVIGVWSYVALNSATFGGGETRQRNLLPYQKLIGDRPSDEQRMFRDLQEGLLEAERARSTTNQWPSVQKLEVDAIPPFAKDPTNRSSYQWHMIQEGTFVNYLGIPTAADAPAWLVLVQEPEPGAPPDPAGEDEEHHRLVNGPMLHVSTWLHPTGGRIENRLVRLPQAEGWTQFYVVGPTPVRLPIPSP